MMKESVVTLMVDDLDRAVAFWTGVLDFELLYRAGPHFAMTRGAGMQVGLHPRGEGPASEAAGGISIGFSVDDIEAAVGELAGRGVDFPGGVVSDDGAVLRASFSDPDGTPLYLVQVEGEGSPA